MAKFYFGYNKVAIESGIGDDGHGKCIITALLRENDASPQNRLHWALCDFKTVENVDALIDALNYVREKMIENADNRDTIQDSDM